MKSNYKKLGEFIAPAGALNNGMEVDNLLGISNAKYFQKAKTNTIGINLEKYRIVRKGQFAFNRATTRNGDKISIALREESDCIVSPSYRIFEVVKTDELMSEYLMMWFRRPEFDRYARYKSHGSAHEFFEYEDMCEVELPVPSIDKQREIVKEYHTIVDRIKLNEELNQKLEDTAQSIYKEWFDKWSELELLEEMTLNDICSLITDGKHGDCKNKLNSGYYFVSVKDLEDGEINYNNARQITKKDFEETDRRTNFSKGDILFTNSGTIGRMVIGKENIETRKTTFQKSVAILKTKENYSESYYLYCLLKCNLKEIQELASGTSQSNLLLGSLRDFSIFHPKYIEVQNFEKQISPIFKFLEYRSKENKYLKQLKDVLLSKMATIEG